jgi:hypothetical protein
MKFDGYWVSKVDGTVSVIAGEFDETELTQASDWTEAMQNEEPTYPHGFIKPLAMLHSVCEKLVGELGMDERSKLAAELRGGATFPVTTVEEFARLVQLCIPRAERLPSVISAPTHLATDTAHDDDEIPFKA